MTVYFVQRTDNRWIKIGYARIVHRRLQTLTSNIGTPVEILGFCEGDEADERALHVRFGHLRTNGEWFLEAPEILSAIEVPYLSPRADAIMKVRVPKPRADTVGYRVGAWLRLRYRTNVAQQVADQFGVSKGAAKRWMLGYAPTSEHFQAMVSHWGWEFVYFVFEPICGARPVSGRDLDLAQIRLSLERLEARAVPDAELTRRSELPR